MHGGCEGSVACCLPASALTSKQARTRIGAQPAATSSAPVVFALAERGCIVRLGGSAGRPGRRRANGLMPPADLIFSLQGPHTHGDIPGQTGGPAQHGTGTPAARPARARPVRHDSCSGPCRAGPRAYSPAQARPEGTSCRAVPARARQWPMGRGRPVGMIDCRQAGKATTPTRRARG
jgi:hypothetical protein